MRIIFLVVWFLFMGAFFIISNHELHMNSYNNFSFFYEAYINWLSQLGSNVFSITGNIAKIDWLPQNQKTNDSISSITNSE